MKQKILNIIIIIVLTSFFINSAYSQLVNNWSVIDSSSIRYYNDYPNIDYVNENDIVLFGNRNLKTSSSAINNIYEISKFTNRANNKTILYIDSVNTTDIFSTIQHPSENVISIVGYNGFLLGDFSGNQYMYSSLLVLSTDSGITWERKIFDSNEVLFDISMCNENYGIIAKSNKSNYFNNINFVSEYNLLSTNDCWKTYKMIELPNKGHRIRKIYCESEENMILLMENGGLDYLLTTKNAGKTWIQSANFDFNLRISDLKFIKENYAIAVGSRKLSKEKGQIPIILSSLNGGINWNEDVNFRNEIIRNNNNERLKFADFTDSLNGIISSSRRIYLTEDGGSSWKVEDLVPDKFYHNGLYFLNMVICPSKDFYLAPLGQDYIMKSETEKRLIKPKFEHIPYYYYQLLNNVRIDWTKIEGASSYKFKMAGISKDSSDIPANYNWDKPKVDTIIYDNFLVLNELETNFTYWMYVKAIGENNESEWSEEARLGTYKYETELSPPDIITPEDEAIVSPGDINLIWTKFKYADYYFLKVRDLTDVTNIQVILEENFIIDTTRQLTLLQPSSRYQIRLSSCIDDTTYSLTRVSHFYTWFEPLGVDDYQVNEKNTSLEIYPNPTNGKSYIVLNSEIDENSTINVYDIRGNKILTFEKNLIAGENSIQINSEFLTTGIYFVEVKSSEEIKRGFFIKQ